MTALCPVCKTTNSTVELTFLPSEAAQSFVLRQRDEVRHNELARHIENLWSAEKSELRRCKSCAFRYASPYVAGDKLFYNLAYEINAYPSAKWEFDRTIEDIQANGIRLGSVLEIGAGFGDFLDKLGAATGVSASGVTALEYSDVSASVLRKKGYSTAQCDPRDLSVSDHFDGIFIFQVVEHLDRLDDLFSKIRDLLKPGGVAYISVPNPARITFNESHGSLLDTPPNHIGQWNRKAFELIAGQHHLDLVAFDTEPFSWRRFLKEDIVYSFKRRAEKPGTIENLAFSLKKGRLQRVVCAAFAILRAPVRIPVWLEAARTADLGGSIWAKLQKPKA